MPSQSFLLCFRVSVERAGAEACECWKGRYTRGRSGSRNCALSWMPRIKANKHSYEGGTDVAAVVRSRGQEDRTGEK